jgi:hypothetical protein
MRLPEQEFRELSIVMKANVISCEKRGKDRLFQIRSSLSYTNLLHFWSLQTHCCTRRQYRMLELLRLIFSFEYRNIRLPSTYLI